MSISDDDIPGVTSFTALRVVFDPKKERFRLETTAGVVYVDLVDVLDAMGKQILARKFAQLGGCARSPRKAAAPRANGRKGGRPRRE